MFESLQDALFRTVVHTRVIQVLAVVQSMLYHLYKLGRLLCALLLTRTINLIFACRRSPELGPLRIPKEVFGVEPVAFLADTKRLNIVDILKPAEEILEAPTEPGEFCQKSKSLWLENQVGRRGNRTVLCCDRDHVLYCDRANFFQSIEINVCKL